MEKKKRFYVKKKKNISYFFKKHTNDYHNSRKISHSAAEMTCYIF